MIVLFGNRFVQGSDIGSRDIAYVHEMLGDSLHESIDLLIETNGGETNATEAIVSLFHECVSDYRVLIANAAKSNGTLIALSASTLLMQEVKQQNFFLHVAGQQALRQSAMLAERYLREGMMKNTDPQKLRVQTQSAGGLGDYVPVARAS